jgi:hypothetical protein
MVKFPFREIMLLLPFAAIAKTSRESFAMEYMTFDPPALVCEVERGVALLDVL